MKRVPETVPEWSIAAWTSAEIPGKPKKNCLEASVNAVRNSFYSSISCKQSEWKSKLTLSIEKEFYFPKTDITCDRKNCRKICH